MKGLLKIYQFFFAKIALAMFLFSLSRFLFWIFNSSLLGPVSIMAFLGGLQFDIMAITWVYFPFVFVQLFFYQKAKKLTRLLFHLSNGFCILLNSIDLVYFPFTLKRTGSELFLTEGLANDIWTLMPQYLSDFWYIALLIVGLIYFSIKAYNWIEKKAPNALPLKSHLAFVFPVLILIGIGSRGGVQLRPLGVLAAGKYASAKASPLVLNTPFTILKSSYKEDLKSIDFYSEKDLNQYFDPLHRFAADTLPKKLNVVVFILESFSKEYIGTYGMSEGYTPNLDQILSQSLHFSRAYANGKKSIEALPAILAGIPNLMNGSFISSQYAANKMDGVPSSLKDYGYQTSFYHGGENGTMGFDAYTALAGTDRYIGKTEYPSPADDDGNWGIYDEPFLNFCLEDFNRQEKPFFASIFTLSSHHPYQLPKEYENQFQGGELPILKSIEYADYALGQFFEKAKKEDWFEETLFVLTADHTGPSLSKKSGSRTGIYEIPLAFYCPKYLKPQTGNQVVQQSDIYPSIMDFLGLETQFISFGNSVFDSTAQRFAINYINQTYQLISGDYSLISNGKEVTEFYRLSQDPEMQQNLLTENSIQMNAMNRQLKALIQQYNQRLIQNQMTASHEP